MLSKQASIVKERGHSGRRVGHTQVLCLGRLLSPWYIELSPKNVLSISEHPTMLTRFVATTVLGIAFLFSQGGNFLIAALCPHLQSEMTSCERRTAEPAMSHEDMGHMEHEMAPDPLPRTNSHSTSFEIDKHQGACLHCAVHSGTTPRTAPLREAENAKRTFDLSIPLQVSRVAPATESTLVVLSSRAHGPPGEGPARYILINNFRI